MTDTPTPEPDDDDEIPPVRFQLRNATGDAAEVKIHQPMLGLEPYVLLTAGEDGPEIEGSHLTLVELAETLTFVLGTLWSAPDLDPDAVADMRAVLDDVVDTREGKAPGDETGAPE